MFLNKISKNAALIFISLLLFTPISYAGNTPITSNITDSATNLLISFFDLRDRESFVQFTNTSTSEAVLHVQIFDVANNCNENNFFDAYTGNDTHVYNMRDIQTNDSNPSGVVLPDNAYGFVVIFNNSSEPVFIGNFRILDDNGYEYRTNSTTQFIAIISSSPLGPYTFNFNKEAGVTLSDVVGINLQFDQPDALAADVVSIHTIYDVDIINDQEVPFSCRDVIFACTDQNNPLLEELLEVGGANVASFEYGINEAIPHSRGGELLCPGNNITEGIVVLTPKPLNVEFSFFSGFIGLNNGNGRGSMDSWWFFFNDLFIFTT